MTKLSNYIKYTDFDPERLSIGKWVDKETKDDKGIPVKYKEVELNYTYTVRARDGSTTTVTAKLCVVGPEADASYGIRQKPQTKAYKQFDLPTTYDMKKEEHARFADRTNGFIEKLRQRAVELLLPHAAKLGVEADNVEDERRGLLQKIKSPLYWPKDEVTKKLIPNSNPTLYGKLRHFEGVDKTTGKPYLNKTPFFALSSRPMTGVPPTPMDWRLLMNKCVTHRSAYVFDTVYVGASVSLQYHIEEVTVTDISDAVVTQLMSNDDIATEEKVSKLEARLAEMQAKLAASGVTEEPGGSPTSEDLSRVTMPPSESDGIEIVSGEPPMMSHVSAGAGVYPGLPSGGLAATLGGGPVNGLAAALASGPTLQRMGTPSNGLAGMR